MRFIMFISMDPTLPHSTWWRSPAQNLTLWVSVAISHPVNKPTLVIPVALFAGLPQAVAAHGGHAFVHPCLDGVDARQDLAGMTVAAEKWLTRAMTCLSITDTG